MFFTKKAQAALKGYVTEAIAASVVEERKYFFENLHKLKERVEALEQENKHLLQRLNRLTELHDDVDARVAALSKKPNIKMARKKK